MGQIDERLIGQRLRCSPDWLGNRLRRWLRRNFAISGAHAGQASPFAPRLGVLEPRIVLNATAELTALGLSVFGDADDDVVQVTLVDAGASLQLLDGTGSIIPIDGHNSGPTGNETDPLALSLIGPDGISIDLGAGNDLIQIELPDAINLSVIDGGGDDRVELDIEPDGTPSPPSDLSIDSETIDLTPSGPTVQLADRDVLFSGTVVVGDPGLATRLDVGDGALTILGDLEIGGTIQVFGDAGSVDWSAANVSSTVSSASVLIEFGMTAGSTIELGTFDDFAGSAVEDLQVVSATDVTLGDEILLDGDLSIRAEDSANVLGDIFAQQVEVSGGDVSSSGTLFVDSGIAVLSATDTLDVSGDIDTTAAGNAGIVTLGGATITLDGNQIATDGGNVVVAGPVELSGAVLIDTGGGDVSFLSPVRSAPFQGGSLDIIATGFGAGDVQFDAEIGMLLPGSGQDLQSLSVEAGSIAIREVGVNDGDVTLTADRIDLLGTVLRVSDTAGSIFLSGDVHTSQALTTIFATDDLSLDGSLTISSPTDRVLLSAGGAVLSTAAISGGNRVTFDAGSDVELGGTVSGSAEIIATAGDQILLTASLLESPLITFESESVFSSDATVVTGAWVLEDTLSIADSVTVQLDGSLAEPTTGTVEKLGNGTLVLLDDTTASLDILVQEGTLRVDASLGPAVTVDVALDATLSGSGSFDGDVLINGNLAPIAAFPASSEAALTFQSLAFTADATYAVDIGGASAGTTLDSLIINDTIDLAGAELTLNITAAIDPDTEMLIVQNNGSSDIVGRFTAAFDADGNALATPRVLEEGALVLNSFGSGGNAAYLTYFGGDGNDAALVTAGDHVQDPAEVTVITRRGADLEIRQGVTVADAINADPTVRPIAGLNGNVLTIPGLGFDAQLIIDIDGFVDTSAAALHFDADIVFDVESDGGIGRLTVFDSDETTIDAPEHFTVEYDDADTLAVTLDHSSAVIPDYEISLLSVDNVLLDLPSETLQFNLSPVEDDVSLLASATAGFNELSVSTDLEFGVFSFRNPTQDIVLDGRAGDDLFFIESFDDDFDATISVLGGDDFDDIQWDATATLGGAGLGNPVVLRADGIQFFGDLTLTGGGDVIIDAVDELLIAGTIDSEDGRILIDSEADFSDLGGSTLLSTSFDDAIRIRGFDLLLGDVVVDTRLLLGDPDDPERIGAISQAAGTGLVADELFIDSFDGVFLDSTLNDIRRLEATALAAITFVNANTESSIFAVTEENIDVTTAGNLTVERLETFGDITVQTAGDILGDPLESFDHLIGFNIDLQSHTGFPGPSQPFTFIGLIGEEDTPLLVSASNQFSATVVDGGSVFVSASIDGEAFGLLPVGRVDATDGTVRLRADEINDASDDDVIDLFADVIDLGAELGIGGFQTLTLGGTSDITAVTDSGPIQLRVDADRVATLREISTAGDGDSVLIEHFGDDRLLIEHIENLDGSVSVIADAATIDVLLRAAGESILAGGDGDLLLRNDSGDTDLIVRGEILSDFGNVDLLAQRNIVFLSEAAIDSLEGDVTLSAGNRTRTDVSVVDLQDGSVIDGGDGTVMIDAPGDVFVSSVRSASFDDAIDIFSLGSVIDAGDSDSDLIAEDGLVRIDAVGGIGDGDALDTEIGRLVALVSDIGAVSISEFTEIELEEVRTEDGPITVESDGTLTALLVESVNASDEDGDLFDRDIRLSTFGFESDIVIGLVQAEGVTDVHLESADDVLAIDDDSLLIADDLRIVSENLFDDGDVAVRLFTTINELEAAVIDGQRGDIVITETDSIALASSDRLDDEETVQTINGEIVVVAGESITIDDLGLIDDGNDLRDDLEIIAGGDNGRIHLEAGQTLALGDLVQLFAEQTSVASVTFDAQEYVLGELIQIETGDAVGVARHFAPRPDVGLTETAFYDFTSISTNRLEQAAVNDATGILTVDIGRAGERGLTIDIDWGAETARFQQIDNLSGDAPPLAVSHLYLEGDILLSRLNGRASSTAPLEVRFSVRHHESILVTGPTVEQSGSGTQVVEGELVSSTDNPLTFERPGAPTLENGTAQFIIPNLTIPVAFFPVRDVLPTIETQPVIVATEQTFTILGGGFETSEAAPTTSAGRDEYFQIRVRSPDPDGEDLIAPKRLPDDIIEGDRLKQLLQGLPDGRYEIEYVLGDGNIRSILTVDVRDGKPIQPSADIDGGPLQLVPIESETDDLDDAESSPPDAPSSDDTAVLINGPRQPSDPTTPVHHRPLSIAGRLRSRWMSVDTPSTPSVDAPTPPASGASH